MSTRLSDAHPVLDDDPERELDYADIAFYDVTSPRRL